MRETHLRALLGCLALLSGCFIACGDDDDQGLSEAQRHGVGAACDSDDDCYVGDVDLTCLPFKGGYCGLQGCQANSECPSGSSCITHEDGSNYCFLVCADKPECNTTRPGDIQANCSSNVTFVDPMRGSKACVPPS